MRLALLHLPSPWPMPLIILKKTKHTKPDLCNVYFSFVLYWYFDGNIFLIFQDMPYNKTYIAFNFIAKFLAVFHSTSMSVSLLEENAKGIMGFTT